MAQAQRPIFDLRFTLLVLLQLVTLAALGINYYQEKSASQGKAYERDRDVATRLESVGLAAEAAGHYEAAYKLAQTDLDRGRLAAAIARLYAKQGSSERALAWYYALEDLNAEQALHDEAKKQIVALLETLNKSAAAKQALKESTELKGDAKAQAQGAPIAAMLGQRPIYLYEVQAAFDALPQSYKAEIGDSKPKREEFLRHYVAEEVLRQKAERLGLAERPEFVKQLDGLKRQLLVQALLQRELPQDFKIDESDLKNYFAAKKDRYVSKEQPQPNFDSLRERVSADYRQEKLGEQYQKIVSGALQNEEVKLYPEVWP